MHRLEVGRLPRADPVQKAVVGLQLHRAGSISIPATACAADSVLDFDALDPEAIIRCLLLSLHVKSLSASSSIIAFYRTI